MLSKMIGLVGYLFGLRAAKVLVQFGELEVELVTAFKDPELTDFSEWPSEIHKEDRKMIALAVSHTMTQEPIDFFFPSRTFYREGFFPVPDGRPNLIVTVDLA